MSRYLSFYRPAFPRADAHPYLWASSKAGPLTDGAIYSSIMKHTQKKLGVGVNLHLFRDCAASSFSTYLPEHVYAASELLGHTKLSTLHEYYINANTINAGKAFQESVNDIREKVKSIN